MVSWTIRLTIASSRVGSTTGAMPNSDSRHIITPLVSVGLESERVLLPSVLAYTRNLPWY